MDKFSEGLAAIEINGKYGYINTNGKMCIRDSSSCIGFII
ncbi:WG repeat-containing protein [Acinetobacter haemolyticus]|nr:WG repeat-containing protein [Acinetobacter haemolyticus]